LDIARCGGRFLGALLGLISFLMAAVADDLCAVLVLVILRSAMLTPDDNGFRADVGAVAQSVAVETTQRLRTVSLLMPSFVAVAADLGAATLGTRLAAAFGGHHAAVLRDVLVELGQQSPVLVGIRLAVSLARTVDEDAAAHHNDLPVPCPRRGNGHSSLVGREAGVVVANEVDDDKISRIAMERTDCADPDTDPLLMGKTALASQVTKCSPIAGRLCRVHAGDLDVEVASVVLDGCVIDSPDYDVADGFDMREVLVGGLCPLDFTPLTLEQNKVVILGEVRRQLAQESMEVLCLMRDRAVSRYHMLVVNALGVDEKNTYPLPGQCHLDQKIAVAPCSDKTPDRFLWNGSVRETSPRLTLSIMSGVMHPSLMILSRLSRITRVSLCLSASTQHQA
jgi:hypothetical protein